jgi:uncharacterized membrane protein (GlpM family)
VDLFRINKSYLNDECFTIHSAAKSEECIWNVYFLEKWSVYLFTLIYFNAHKFSSGRFTHPEALEDGVRTWVVQRASGPAFKGTQLAELDSPIPHFVFLTAPVYFAKLCRRLLTAVKSEWQADHIANMTELWHAHKILVRKPSRKVGLGVDGRTISKWIIRKLGVKVWTGFNCLKTGSNGRLLRTR